MDHQGEKPQMKQMITVSIQEWKRLNQQVRVLREQNLHLKERMSRNYTPLITKNRSLIYRHSDVGLHEQAFKPLSQKQKFKSEMSDWSKRMASRKDKIKLSPLKINRKIRNSNEKEQEAKQISLFGLGKEQSESKQLESPRKNQELLSPLKIQIPTEEEKNYSLNCLRNELKLIQNICLYGPNEKQIQEASQKIKSETNVSLIYSINPSTQEQYLPYGEHLYPAEGVPYRKLKPQQVTTCTDKIIFRKNAKRMDCSLILFQAEQGITKLKQKNQILNRVNPIKRLATFYVQFNDFMFVQCEEELQDNQNKSLEILKNKSELDTSGKEGLESTRQKREKVMKKYCVKSSFCLCIFTYFPFVNVMKQLITSVMDEVKIRRVENYANKQITLEQVSIKYFMKELNSIGSELVTQISSIPMQIGEEIVLSLGHFKIIFNFIENRIDDLLFGGWVFNIMKLFHRDTLYDVFTSFMTQESICFCCENLQLLTETVFFFASVLANPFEYPHPCISRTLNYDLLDSPFVVTLGFSQPSKWVEENAQRYQKRIFVDLNGLEAKVYNIPKGKAVKSEKLKKIFHNFYKKLQGSSPMPQFFKKKQTIIRPATRQQNQLVITFVKGLQKFFEQEIVAHLPNPQIIDTIKESSPEPNEHSKISSLLREVQKYVKQSRKPSQKDSFIQLLVEQQVFYMYVSYFYGLKSK